MFESARLRLTLWFAGVFTVIIILIGGAVLLVTRATLYERVNDELQDRTDRLVASLFVDRPAAVDPEFVRQLALADFRVAGRLLGGGGYSAALITPSQTLSTENYTEIEAPDRVTLLEATAGGATVMETQTSEGEEYRLYVRPIRNTDSYIAVGRSIEPEVQALRRLLFVEIAGGFAGLSLALAGGYWIAGRALRPIQQSVDAQREFVADASHELRTPLALIRANAEILKRDAGKPTDMTSVDDIIAESDRLSYLVGQMLTLARADSQDTRFETEPVHLGRVAQDIARQMQLLANDKGISVRVETAGNTIVDGDEQRLGELLIILLDNAIKYTDNDGSVMVVASEAAGRVRLSVADTGRGIQADELERVFDRFYRTDRARSREMGGTGLGLAIAKWIVDSHGGTIAVSSEVGKGTTVSVDLAAADISDMADSSAMDVTAIEPATAEPDA